MRYAVARYNLYQRDMAYRIYVTETQRILAKGMGCEIDSFTDMLETVEHPDNRTGDEIAADIIKKMGIKVVSKD